MRFSVADLFLLPLLEEASCDPAVSSDSMGFSEGTLELLRASDSLGGEAIEVVVGVCAVLSVLVLDSMSICLSVYALRYCVVCKLNLCFSLKFVCKF